MRVVAPAILIIWRTRWNEHALREQFGERVQAVDPPHVGHFLLLEQPEAVARGVSEFLGLDQCSRTPRPFRSAASTATSQLAGTLCKVTRCGVSKADTVSGSTAFFAPLIG